MTYSGHYGFASTEMYWPLSHMVASKEKALICADCHTESSKAENGRLNWKALGYEGDPIYYGARRLARAASNQTSQLEVK
jgi:hypothetical protein